MVMTAYTDRTDLADLKKAARDGAYIYVSTVDCPFTVLANVTFKDEWIIGQELGRDEKPRYGDAPTYINLAHVTRLRLFCDE